MNRSNRATNLERQMLAAQEGRAPEQVFMQQLLAAQVFMPVRDDDKIKGFQRSTLAVPLSLQDEEGNQVLVLFSSPERAKPFVKDFPGYEGGMLAEFTWVLQKMGTGYAVTLNPGWDVGLDLQPEAVQQLAAQAGRMNS